MRWISSTKLNENCGLHVMLLLVIMAEKICFCAITKDNERKDAMDGKQEK